MKILSVFFIALLSTSAFANHKYLECQSLADVGDCRYVLKGRVASNTLLSTVGLYLNCDTVDMEEQVQAVNLRRDATYQPMPAYRNYYRFKTTDRRTIYEFIFPNNMSTRAVERTFRGVVLTRDERVARRPSVDELVCRTRD